jgi:L-malate glycosyltransferase
VSKVKPHLGFVGHMLGRNPGYVTTQGQIVAELFLRDGYPVFCVSSRINRVLRLAEMIQTVILQRKSTDILVIEVYSGLSFMMADVVSLVSKYFMIPNVGVLHGGNLPQFAARFPRWTSRVLRRFNELVTPSAFLADEIEKYDLRASVIPNVVDFDAYPFKLRQKLEPRLVWMRAFHSIYHPAMALRVFAIIRRDHPDASMVMAGVDKGLEPSIKSMAKDMGLEHAVRFPGFLDHEAKIKEFSIADIYLNTNRIDNMPVTVIEACAMGLPVVATDVGGLRDLITNGQNGILVPDGGVHEMASAVNRLLNDPDLARQISENGRLLAENSAWTYVRNRWENLFADISDREAESKTTSLSVNI